MTDNAGGARRVHWNEIRLPSAVTDALGRQGHFRYDDSGQLSEVVDAANTAQARLFDTNLCFKRDVHGRHPMSAPLHSIRIKPSARIRAILKVGFFLALALVSWVAHPYGRTSRLPAGPC